MPQTESDERVTLGRVLRPHGVRGAVLVAADASVHDAFRPGLRCRLDATRTALDTDTVEIATVTAHPSGLRVQFAGVETRDDARALVGALLGVAPEQMPEPGDGRYYDYEIIGLDAVSSGADGRTLGKVVEIIETGANDVYVIAGTSAGEILVPATAHAVLAVDLDLGRIVVDLEATVSSKPSSDSPEPTGES